MAQLLPLTKALSSLLEALALVAAMVHLAFGALLLQALKLLQQRFSISLEVKKLDLVVRLVEGLGHRQETITGICR
jgi:hypothetical protein